MNARSGEFDGGGEAGSRRANPLRVVALAVAIIACGLGTGFAIGSLVKDGPSARRSPPSPAASLTLSSESPPVVRTMRASATLPSLRGKSGAHRTTPASATSGSSTAASAATSTATSSVQQQSGVTQTPSETQPPSPTPTQKQTPRSHGESSEVHHESGGGA
jgi:hypothetical protein